MIIVVQCDFSLPNLSQIVRWSLDFRWQKASESIGYYGLKDGVLLRSSTDPNFKIDWESFDSVDRHDPNSLVGPMLALSTGGDSRVRLGQQQ